MTQYRDDHVIWVEKYRPRCVDDCILPGKYKDIFLGIVQDKLIPNLLLSGPSGSGKTTVAQALCFELDYEYLFLNASKERGIETIRTSVTQFCSSLSLEGKRRKAVIFDEADYLTPEAQTALRSLVEEFAANCTFIFTCNYKNKIIQPIHSRCSCFEFRISKEDKSSVLRDLVFRLKDILQNENINYDKEVLPKVILKYFPDYRRLINEIQSYAKAKGQIDEGILSLDCEIDIYKLFVALKSKKFQDVREWTVSALDNDANVLYRKVYDGLKKYIKLHTIPPAILIIADYQYKSAFSMDPEICFLACMIELMTECEFV